MATEHADGNRLGAETSPYLLQHKDNPVHWMAWGDAAFDRAKKENKPILLSVGYAACHWCHVMAHESFEDDRIADLMNQLFVNVKVDREERPDVDALYQHALALMGEQGGWPLTMFLTPEGEPFWGGTYFPSEPRYGRPGFPQVLQRLAEVYHQEGDKVRANADALKEALGKLSANQPGEGVPVEAVDQVAREFLRLVDPAHGGLQGAPKFPQPQVFDLMWRAYRRTGAAEMKNAVLLTLERMCQGGIYDHLGGGFARYSTDEFWLAPHFEKMLYDNAQLVDLLTHAWLDTGNPLFEERVRETVDWLEREMRIVHKKNKGAWAGTLDADSEGEEGKFYVWTEAEIDAVLGEDAELFKHHYDVGPGGNWEGKTILNRTQRPERMDDQTEDKLRACRAKLLEKRAERVRPALDDKVMPDWNGLMIAALAHAGIAFGVTAWIDISEQAFHFIVEEMSDPDGGDGALKHSWRGGKAAHPGTLDDYANMARAALMLHQVTGKNDYLDRAREWAAYADAHFWDGTNGGYFLSADTVSDVPMRTKTAYDNASPSGNGMMAHVLAELYYLTGEDAYRERAEALLRAFAGELGRNALAIPVLLSGAEKLAQAVQVVVVGEPDAKDAAALERAAFGVSVPNRVFQKLTPEDALPKTHPAHGKGLEDGKAAAYVCRGTVCTLPLTEPDGLKRELAEY